MGVLVLALLVWFHIPNRATASPGSDTKPKLIFFLTDDLDVDYPNQTWIDHYPRLKALLADRGTTFRNSFVSLPLCCPSRTSILRGQYAHNTTIFGLAPPVGWFADVHARGLEQSTIATWLQTAGYRTILLGKYQNGYGTTEVGPTYVPPGRDEWYAGVSNAACDQFNYALNESGHVVHYGDSAEDDLQDVLRDKALAFLAQNTGDEHRRPFVMNFSAYSPRLLAPVAPRHADIFPNILAPPASQL